MTLKRLKPGYKERFQKFCSTVYALGELADEEHILCLGGMTRQEKVNDQRLCHSFGKVRFQPVGKDKNKGRWTVTNSGKEHLDPEIIQKVVAMLEVRRTATRHEARCPQCGLEASTFLEVDKHFGYRKMSSGTEGGHVHRPQSNCRECRRSKAKPAKNKE